MAEQKRKLLIIDDERDFAVSLQDILESRDYGTDTAFDAEQALTKLRETDFPVCLLDIRLGRSSGLDLIGSIRDIRPKTLCVLMTAYADTETAIQALKRGAYDYLRKPFAAEELFPTLERCYERIQLEEQKAKAEEELLSRNRELAEINARLEKMVGAAQKLAACQDQRELSRRLLEEFAYNMAVEGGSLFICLEDKLELVHSLDPGHVPHSIPLPPAEGTLLARVYGERKPVVIQDIGSQQELMPSGWDGYRDGSLLLLPLIDPRGMLLGILTLHNKRWPPFTQADIDVGLILISLSMEILRSLRALMELGNSEKYLHELIENSMDIILVFDENDIVRFCSPSVQRIMGYRPETLVGTKIDSYCHPDDLDGVARMFRSLLEEPAKISRIEARFRHSDGSWRILETFAKNTLTPNPVGGIVVNARDVTDRYLAEQQKREHEEQLFQASKLASLGTLVSGVAHEINNPNNYMRLITQNFSALWQDIEQVLEGVAREKELELSGLPYQRVSTMVKDMFRGLSEGSKRIERLVENLKDYARKDNGELDNPVDLRRVAESAMEILRSLAKKSTDNFEVELPDSLPAIYGNSNQLEQVLINLLSNAFQSLPSRDRSVKLAMHHAAELGCVEIIIEDQGEGISREDLSQIMDPFFTTKREQGGTGLGLSISHRIVQNHGGEMLFESEKGHGTKVSVRLPLERESSSKEQQ